MVTHRIKNYWFCEVEHNLLRCFQKGIILIHFELDYLYFNSAKSLLILGPSLVNGWVPAIQALAKFILRKMLLAGLADNRVALVARLTLRIWAGQRFALFFVYKQAYGCGLASFSSQIKMLIRQVAFGAAEFISTLFVVFKAEFVATRASIHERIEKGASLAFALF